MSQIKTDENCYDVILRLKPKLMAMLKRTCSPDYEDAWSEVVVDRAPRVFETFRPGVGERDGVPIDAYFMRTMWFYARKWAGKHYSSRRDVNLSQGLQGTGNQWLEDESFVIDDRARGLEAKRELEDMLSQLSDYDAWVIRKHSIEGYTFEELAAPMKLSRSAVCAHHKRAMDALRELALSE